MIGHLALLASSNPSLLESVERLIPDTESLRVERIGTTDDVWARVSSPEVALVIVHVPADVEDPAAGDLARKVAASGRLCRIVGLADVYQAAHAAAFHEAGAADYLPGPFDFAKLEAHLREATKKQTSAAEALTSWNADTRDPGFYVLGAEFAELMEQVRRTAPQD